MAKIAFRLVMPERELVHTDADMIIVPGVEGDFGVIHGHAPLISTVRPGVLEVIQGSKAERRFLVVGGFAEVTPQRCTVLADEATPFEQVTAEQLAERERSAQREVMDAVGEAEKEAAQKQLAVAKDLIRAHAYYAAR